MIYTFSGMFEKQSFVGKCIEYKSEVPTNELLNLNFLCPMPFTFFVLFLFVFDKL